MNLTDRVLAIIPARAGSKRVPNKNIRPIAGTNLTKLAMDQALGSSLLTDIVLSSDSEEILALADGQSRIVSLKRPLEFSTDESPAIEYIRHALSVMEQKRNAPYSIVVVLQPSSPLRKAVDIDNSISLLANHPEADSVVSVVKVQHMIHPLKMKVLHGNELRPFLEDEKGRFIAKELPDVYVRNCAVYATWRTNLEIRADVIGAVSLGYVMSPETSVDINEMIEFEFAEFLMKKLK